MKKFPSASNMRGRDRTSRQEEKKEKKRDLLSDSERDEGVFIDNSIIVASLVTSDRLQE